MIRFLFIAAFFSYFISQSAAQDTAKRPKPVQQSPNGAKPVYKSQLNNKYSATKADSGSKHGDISATGALKDDSLDTGPTDKSLNGQYQYALTKVYHYQQPFITSLWKSVSDTLAQSRLKLKDAEGKMDAQNKTIEQLKADSVTSAQNLVSKRENIDAFGITMSLTFYNVVVWGLIIALGITVFAVISQSGGNRTEAQYRIKLFKELEEEFKAYKTKANDKEKKLARELQTERNKVDELLGRG
jgi:hypothetical protein